MMDGLLKIDTYIPHQKTIKIVSFWIAIILDIILVFNIICCFKLQAKKRETEEIKYI